MIRTLRERGLIAILTGLLIIMCSSPAFAIGDTYSSGYYKYKVEDESITIIDYFGQEEAIEIPSSIAGYPVSTIKTGAFKGAKDLKSITLPETIMTIERDAFRPDQKVIYPLKDNKNSTVESGDTGEEGKIEQNSSEENKTAESSESKQLSEKNAEGVTSESTTDSGSDSIQDDGEEDEDFSIDGMEDDLDAVIFDPEHKKSKKTLYTTAVVVMAIGAALFVIFRSKRKQ